MFRLLRSLVFLGLAVGAAWWVGKLYLEQKALVDAENRATQSFGAGDFQKARKLFEKVLVRVPPTDTTRQRRLHTRIAACIIPAAEDPSLPLDEALVLYREALDHDPDADIPANVRRLMEMRDAKRP